MKEQISLRRDYIKVQRRQGQEVAYGGDQNFFATREEDSEKGIKQQSGCGLIALLDLCLYLAAHTNIHEEQYVGYFDRLYDFYGGIRHNTGISGIGMAKCFNKIMKRNKMHLRAKWGLKGNKMHARIIEMLSNDIPVVLCIPQMVLKKDKANLLNLYEADDMECKVACRTNAHYVMVTAIVSLDNEEYYKISSWGKKYFISVKEYDSYMKHHFLGTILGNVLYVQKR